MTTNHHAHHRTLKTVLFRLFMLLSLPLMSGFSCAMPAKQLEVSKTLSAVEFDSFMSGLGLTCLSCEPAQNYRVYAANYHSKTLWVQLNTSINSGKYYLLVFSSTSSGQSLVEEYTAWLNDQFSKRGMNVSGNHGVPFGTASGNGLRWGDTVCRIQLPPNDAFWPSTVNNSENRLVANRVRKIIQEVSESLNLQAAGPQDFNMNTCNSCWVSNTVNGPLLYSRTATVCGCNDDWDHISISMSGVDQSLLSAWLDRFSSRMADELPAIQLSRSSPDQHP